MKIPASITKRQHTQLSRKNTKMLKEEIEAQKHDLDIELEWLRDSWDPDNKYMEPHVKGYFETANYWNKEVKAAFRLFISQKRKIEKAYKNGLKKKGGKKC